MNLVLATLTSVDVSCCSVVKCEDLTCVSEEE